MLWIRKVAYQISATPPVPGADRSLFLAHRTAGAGEGATGREAKPSLRRRNLQDAREIKPKNGKNLIDFGEGEQTQQKGRGRNLCSRAHGPLVDQFRWVISRVSGLNASELLVKIRVIPPQITGLRFQVISYHPRSLRYRETVGTNRQLCSHQKAVTDAYISPGPKSQASYKLWCLFAFVPALGPFHLQLSPAQESTHSYSSAGHQLCPP